MNRPEDPSTELVSSQIGVPFAILWDALADSANFPRLYPRRFARVQRLGPNFSVGIGPAGERFALRPNLCRETGVIDVELVVAGGEVERWRSRLVPRPGGGCRYVRLASRRAGVNDAAWEEHRRAVTAEVAHLRTVLEREHAERAARGAIVRSGDRSGT